MPFGAALDVTNWELDTIIIDIYQWFKLSAARREDYTDIQRLLEVPEQTFLRFVECRWLSLFPALERVLLHWDSLREYFVNYLPSKQPQSCRNERYKRIIAFIKEETYKAKIHFLINVALIFSRFQTLFQAEGPLTHILYDKMSELYKEVLGKFVKEDQFAGRSGRSLMDDSITDTANEVEDEKLDIGVKTRDCVKKVSTSSKKTFLFDVRKFLRKVTEIMRKTLPLNNSLLQDLLLLHPLARSEDYGRNAVTRVARRIAHIIPESDLDKVVGQFKVYRNETEINDTWFIEDRGMDADGNPFVKW